MGFVVGAIVAAAGYAVIVGLEFMGVSIGWGFAIALILAIAGAVPVIQDGHRAFKTGANTDLVAYVFVILMAASILGPRWSSGSPPEAATPSPPEAPR